LQAPKAGTPACASRAQAHYDIVIHWRLGATGAATASLFLAKRTSNKKRIRSLEKGWIGGGNCGAQHHIIRSNYLLDGNEPFYEMSLKLWEGLEAGLQLQLPWFQRGILNLIHSDAQRRWPSSGRGNAMLLNGADARNADHRADQETLSLPQHRRRALPHQGRGLASNCGGTVRHLMRSHGLMRRWRGSTVSISSRTARYTGIKILKTANARG